MVTAGQLDCQIIKAYTGKVKCGVSPTAPKALILFPKGTELDAAELATLQATLLAGFTANDYTDRYLLIGDIVGVENNSDEPNRFSFDDGSSQITRNTVYRLRFRHNQGWCYQKNILELNNAESEYDFAIVDTQNIIWLRGVYDDSDAFQYVSGVTASLFEVEPTVMPGFTEAAGYYFTLEISDTTQLNEFGTFLKAGFSVNTMPTVIGAATGNLGSANWTTGTFNVSLTAGCGGAGVNLATQFGTELSATSAWVVTNATTGNAITISSVTALATGAGWAIDVDATDPDYPTSGNSLIIKTASVSTLAGLGVEYYEGFELTLTRP